MNDARSGVRPLTAEAVARAFVLSGQRHLILTGGRGSGKSTLFRPLLPLLSPDAPVLTTYAQPGHGVFLEGSSIPIGCYDRALSGVENKMRPVSEGMKVFRQRLMELGEQGADWAAVDELGYLEASCEAVQAAVWALMERKRLLAVVRKQDLPFLAALREHSEGYRVDLDAPYGSLGCVVMASGLGKRFGGNKLMAELNGRPLLSWALDGTDGLSARRLVVTRHSEVEALCHQRGIAVLRHDLPGRNDMVRLGLEALGPGLDGYLFMPGDQPLVRPETMQALALAAAREPDCIWRLEADGKPGSPVLFPRWSYEELLALLEGQGGRAVIQRHPEQVRLLPAQEFELLDADTPEDLQVIAAQMEPHAR